MEIERFIFRELSLKVGEVYDFLNTFFEVFDWEGRKAKIHQVFPMMGSSLSIKKNLNFSFRV